MAHEKLKNKRKKTEVKVAPLPPRPSVSLYDSLSKQREDSNKCYLLTKQPK